MKMNVNNDAMGNRISKTVTNKNETNGDKFVTTYYVRDPQGNVLAVYEHKHGDSDNGTFTLTEQHLYGASRLGMTKPNLVLSGTGTGSADPTAPSVHYELTNHLGNVLAVITPDASDATQPAIERLTDYYPFGMEMGGRSYNSNDYRFGYTGHEKENDLAEGVYTTQYRLLDTRLGRWMSVDPLFGKYPDMSAYNYCGGNPVVFGDNNGDTLVIKYWWGGHEETYLYSGPTTKVEVDNEFVKTVVETLNYLYGYEESRSNIQTLMLSRRNVAISEVSEISEDAPGKAKPTLQRFANGRYRIKDNAFDVLWCPTLGALLVDKDGNYIGGSQSPSLVLDHELTHATHVVESPTEYYNNCYTDDSDYQNLEERLAIEGHESGAADYFGEYKRTNHSHGGTFRYYGGTHPQESNDIYEDFSGPSIDRGRGSTNQTEIKLKTRE